MSDEPAPDGDVIVYVDGERFIRHRSHWCGEHGTTGSWDFITADADRVEVVVPASRLAEAEATIAALNSMLDTQLRGPNGALTSIRVRDLAVDPRVALDGER